MPKHFRYEGKDVLLGAFGQVRTGDVLFLTTKEADGILDDRRFRPLKGEPDPDKAFAPLKELSTNEVARREGITVYNAGAEDREINEITRAELRSLAAAHGVQAAGWIGKRAMWDRIQEAKRNSQP